MIKLIIVFFFVTAAFGIMLGGMFFGNYKRMRTRYNREKNQVEVNRRDSGFSSCAGCTGTDCHR